MYNIVRCMMCMRKHENNVCIKCCTQIRKYIPDAEQQEDTSQTALWNIVLSANIRRIYLLVPKQRRIHIDKVDVV